MRKWIFFLLCAVHLQTRAAVNYESLKQYHDSLYTFAGHLYTGNAVWKRASGVSQLILSFRLVGGTILYHEIRYSKQGKNLALVYYDNLKHYGEAKDYNEEENLTNHQIYFKESRYCQFFVFPDGNLQYWDSTISPELKMHREYFRNGVIHIEDSIFKRIECTDKQDSLGQNKISITHFNKIIDRLFGPKRFGLNWHGEGTGNLVFNNGSTNKLYALSVEYNQSGGLESVYWGSPNDSFLLHEEYFPDAKPNSLYFGKRNNAILKKWPHNQHPGWLKIVNRRKFRKLSETERNVFSKKLFSRLSE